MPALGNVELATTIRTKKKVMGLSGLVCAESFYKFPEMKTCDFLAWDSDGL